MKWHVCMHGTVHNGVKSWVQQDMTWEGSKEEVEAKEVACVANASQCQQLIPDTQTAKQHAQALLGWLGHPLVRLVPASVAPSNDIKTLEPTVSKNTATVAASLVPKRTEHRRVELAKVGGRRHYLRWADRHELLDRIENLSSGAYLGATFSNSQVSARCSRAK